MAKGSGPGRWIRLALVGIALAVLIIVVIVAVLWWRGRPSESPPPPPPPVPGEPETQPASCTDVQVIAVPGTWESAVDDDPHAPQANPNALLLQVTGYLQDRFDPSRAEVLTVPYVAEFANPTAPPQTTYDDSRAAGTAATLEMISERSAECPLTGYVLIGFSQGAVIAGDVAAQIGAGDGPVAQERLLGVGLVADGRRDSEGPGAAAQQLGVPAGQGAEVMLGFLGTIPGMPGTTMTGARPGGFGEVADRVVQICAPADLICDAPNEVVSDLLGTIGKLTQAAAEPVHALYDSNPIIDGTTATAFLRDWAAEIIEDAPVPRTG